MGGKNSEIKLSIELDKNNVPEKIKWEAEGGQSSRLADAFNLYLWDSLDKSVYNIEMWTKDMMVDDMNIHFFQSLMQMADAYKRATGNAEMAAKIKEFAYEFGEETKIIEIKK